MGAAAAEGCLGAQRRCRDGQRHDDGRDQLQTFRGDIGTQCQRDDKAVDHAARHGGHSLDPHAAAAEERLADDEGRQTDNDHAGAEVDVGRALVLRQHRTGQCRHGVGDAKPHRDGEGRVDRGGAHHVGVITGGADGQAQPGAQKRDEQGADGHRDNHCDQQLGGGTLAESALRRRKDGHGLEHRHIGGKAHDRKVYRIKPRVGDDACQNGGHCQPRLQKRRDKACGGTGQHGQRQPQKWVAGHSGGGRDGTAQRESAVGRHIGDVQHAEAQEQRHRNQRVDEAKLQCIQHGGNGKHRVTSSLKVMVQSIIQQCRGGFHIRPRDAAAAQASRAHIECAPTVSSRRVYSAVVTSTTLPASLLKAL